MRHVIHNLLRRSGVDAPASRTTRIYPPEPYVPSPAEVATLGGAPLVGVCPVCGAKGQFLPFTENVRESGHCAHCRSSNRTRQMAWVVRHELGLPLRGAMVLPDAIAIYNTEANGPLHAALHRHPRYVCSEYWGDKSQYGESIDGVRNEDLQALGFADKSFDLVLSSDVFEHIPHPYVAFREVYRVLKPGGSHIFTVPYGEQMLRDDVRATLVDGEIVYHAEALYHGDPVRPDKGILVWNIFGLEMLVRLGEIGFHVELWRLHEPENGILGSGADVFVATRPSAT